MSTPIFEPTRIKSILFDLGIDVANCNIVFGDDAYCLPTEHWFITEFAAACLKAQEALQLQYEVNAQDCDDFASLGRGYGQILYKRTMDRPKETALAIAEIFYKPTWTPSRHSICCALTSVNEKFKLLFLEPQNGQEQMLVMSEINSTSFMRW